jgi:hypothetical protein
MAEYPHLKQSQDEADDGWQSLRLRLLPDKHLHQYRWLAFHPLFHMTQG